MLINITMFVSFCAKGPVQRPSEDLCKYKTSKEDFRYIDELINKQACEISELKNELRVLKCQQREEITDLERQFVQKEREYNHKITSLEVEVKSAEDRYTNQVNLFDIFKMNFSSHFHCYT